MINQPIIQITISKEEFGEWLKHPMTSLVVEALTDLRERVDKELTNANTILTPNGQLTLAYLAGQRLGLDNFLCIEYEELEGFRDDKDQASRPSDTSNS